MSKARRDRKFTQRIERALIRAAAAARLAARRFGTPIYVWEDGKVVAKRP
jgi:predicted RNase H-like nuclease (RuvC/YqgF family)